MPGHEAGQKDEIRKMDLARDARAFNNKIDPRLCFLERAHARLVLFYAGELSMDEAFDGLIKAPPCACGRERRAA
jgi:hypothetical protein